MKEGRGTSRRLSGTLGHPVCPGRLSSARRRACSHGTMRPCQGRRDPAFGGRRLLAGRQRYRLLANEIQEKIGLSRRLLVTQAEQRVAALEDTVRNQLRLLRSLTTYRNQVPLFQTKI